MMHISPSSIDDIIAATEKECARLKAGWLASEKNTLRLEGFVVELQHKLSDANQRLEKAYQSRSWRWTAWIRKVEWFIRTEVFRGKK